jgi:hypothetical protein
MVRLICGQVLVQRVKMKSATQTLPSRSWRVTVRPLR